MRQFKILPTCITLVMAVALAGCSGEKPVEKAIVGTWVQDTPISMTSQGFQTTTADTVLTLGKSGDVKLTRNLDIFGQDLPAEGVAISLELRGQWEIIDGQLKQTQESALIMPRRDDDASKTLAEDFQAQANENEPTVKDIIAVDRQQLILQDTDTGATDVYRRK